MSAIKKAKSKSRSTSSSSLSKRSSPSASLSEDESPIRVSSSDQVTAKSARKKHSRHVSGSSLAKGTSLDETVSTKGSDVNLDQIGMNDISRKEGIQQEESPKETKLIDPSIEFKNIKHENISQISKELTSSSSSSRDRIVPLKNYPKKLNPKVLSTNKRQSNDFFNVATNMISGLRSSTSTPKTKSSHSKSTLHFYLNDNEEKFLTNDEKLAITLYEKVAKDIYDNGDFESKENKKKKKEWMSRSPYKPGKSMGRGAYFTPYYNKFLLSGGIAKWKNTVMMNVRLNDIRDIYSSDGSGSFKVNFFLDTAFWVPLWDDHHFNTQTTLGEFTRYEPWIQFPEVDVDNGMLRWGSRTAEFSKHEGKSRRHEVQIGQNYETVMDDGKGHKLNRQTVISPNGLANQGLGGSGGGGSGVGLLNTVDGSNDWGSASSLLLKKTSVVDVKSHWPRLWRVIVTETELEQISGLDSYSRALVEPSDEHPHHCHERVANLLTTLDLEREKNLSHPTEGIAFVTYEISCTHRAEFQLNEFPFDMHSLKIVIRVDKKDKDPMQRNIMPIANDKGFAITPDIAELVDYHLARNLDWIVTKEAPSLGGAPRLNASAIVRRKPGYYIRNYIIIIFLLASSSFTSFIVRPDDYETRSLIIFTLLLSVVAFKYSGDDLLPCVSYPTILDTFILLNFYVVLCVGFVSFGFATVCGASGVRSENYKRKVEHDLLCSKDPGRWYGIDFIPAYGPVFESCFGIFVFGIWIIANIWYWLKVKNRVQFNIKVINDIDLGWVKHAYTGSGKKGHFRSEKLFTNSRENPSSYFDF